MAAPNKGYAHIADLVAAAKANPGTLKYGSVGIGSPAHIAGARFSLLAGLNVVHVAYPSAVEAIEDLAAGRIDFYFIPVTPALPLIATGKAIPLAVSTPNRLQSLSGLPTLTESGYPVPTYLTWCGLAAPAKTPLEIVRKLNDAIGKVLNFPVVRTKLLRTGYEPMPMIPEQTATFVAEDLGNMRKLGQEAHIEPLD
jgi:tripartite-type tricarboxylate transporter receptor subunit TctC